MANKRNLKTWLVATAILLGFACGITAAEVIYVDDDASLAGDGTSWATAYKYLQDALYKPPTGGDEIWVAAGTYKPDADEGGNVTPNDRTETFQLINGVAIYGGFAGTETTLDERDWQTNETILSGDINTPDVNSDNSYHVVTGSGTDTTTVLDGFTIKSGNANGSWLNNHGGGMCNTSSNPTVTNCTFSGNSAYYGGGMSNYSGSPTVTNCTFTGNSAVDPGSFGGGMYNYEGSPTVTNCTFSGNSAGEGGGGMINAESDPTVTNCTFSGNSADLRGGGMYNYDSDPNVINCILWGNTAPSGPQIHDDGTSSPTVTYCDVEGGYSGATNIDADPLFVDADGPDNIVGTEDDNLRLSAGSPCIDVGDNSAIPPDTADLDGDGNTTEPIPFDLDGNARILGNVVDMGAYEDENPTLTLMILSTSGGSVTEPGEGNFQYSPGTFVPVVAEADPCYGFVEWTGTAVVAGKVADPCAASTMVIVDADYTLVANFDTHMLTVSSTSGGIVTSPGEGVLLYPSDTVVAIVAEADPCYGFVEWMGTAVVAGKVADPNAATTTVTVDADYTLVANFAKYTLTVSSTSGGSVSQPGQGVFEYAHGTIVPMVAEADPCYGFWEWTGTAVGAGKVADPCAATTTVTVDADYTLVANFVPQKTLTVSSTSGGNVSEPEEGLFWYTPWTVVPIFAAADPCFVFVEWTGTAVDAGKVFDQYAATTTVTVDADYTLMANFRESDYDPDQAWNPSPLDTEMLVYPDVTLSWMPGDRIGTHGRHFVYFGTDETAVGNSPAPLDPGFPGPEYQGFNFSNDLDWFIGKLESGKSYFWRIDEGNEDGSLTKGNVWRFATGANIYVDESATGGNNGSSWDDAYRYLQDALSDPCLAYGDHIWVAEGTYKPSWWMDPNDPRSATFQLINGVGIYGGFPSGGTWEECDPNEYETILSGDIGTPGDNNDNSYHVVTGSGTDATAVLDGFTVTAGNANGSDPDDDGGGMYNDNGSPTLRNCTFSENFAVSWGGGMCNRNGSDPTLTNCTFWGNASVSSSGGGMTNAGSSPLLVNSIFIDNSADYGGGMCNFSCSPKLVNCIFSGNSATGDGGGMRNNSSSPTVINCTFSGNTAVTAGGGMTNASSSEPNITNCIFWGNTRGVFTDESAQIYNPGSTPVVNYCCIQGWTGGLGGTGNIAEDPLFRDADGDDDIVGTKDDDLQLSAYSPCIDAGDNNSVPADTADLDRDGNTAEPIPFDLDGNARFFDDPVTDDTGSGTAPIVDMGAYEFEDVCGDAEHPYPAGDLNHDCYVDFYDFAIFAGHWLEWTGTAVDAGKVADPYAATTTVTVDADYTLMANFRESDYDPDQAWNPSPFDTEMLVYPNVTLSWMPGDGMGIHGRHLVYFGTDYTAVEKAPTPSEPGFPSPEYQGLTMWDDLDWLIGDLQSGKTYYWRIDEGNEDGSITKGNVWRFTTGADIYVDESATGGNNGTSWDDAYNYLQDALSVAEAGDHIWAAAGTYKPSWWMDPNDPRSATFQLINGVGIYGGFASGATWTERDPQTYETILSGDIGTPGDSSDNSYHVVTGSGTDATAVLDGFTITTGNANGLNHPNYHGGGMHNDSGSPTVSNCTFSGNSADSWGGGMFNNYSNPTVTNCTFSGNSAGYGGGMFNANSSPTVSNCTFSGNQASEYGGGMCNTSSSPTVTNCMFSGNSAGNYGGGMYNYNSSPNVTNCILWGNSAPTGPQIYNYGTSSPTVKYCDVEGGYAGTGNIGDDPNDDPLFKDADGEDDIVGTEDDNLRLSAYSPCIDAGDNNSVPADDADLDGDGNTAEPIPFDLDGNARFFDDPVTDDTGSGTPPIVDMGAYEFEDVCGDAEHPYPAGDFNHDCYVDFYDFAIFCLSWLQCTAPECD